jgi:paraquat-inducible protein A
VSVLTAASTGVLTCHACGMLHRTSTIGLGIACRRCGTALHARKRDSITRTWALFIAANVLFDPASRIHPADGLSAPLLD